VASDQVISNVSLQAGVCKVIFIRTQPQLVSAALTVTETANADATLVVDRILRVDATGSAIVTGQLGIVVTENATVNGGSLLVFFNKRISLF